MTPEMIKKLAEGDFTLHDYLTNNLAHKLIESYIYYHQIYGGCMGDRAFKSMLKLSEIEEPYVTMLFNKVKKYVESGIALGG